MRNGRLLLRWCGPALVAVLLTLLTWVGLSIGAQHQAQHRQVEQDHLLLQQVIQVLNSRLAPPSPTPPPARIP